MVFICGCSGSPIRTGRIAEINISNISEIRKGMSYNQVSKILKKPYKTRVISKDNEEYLVCYFITRRSYMYQSNLIDKNFTPVIFSKNILIGWGWPFYNYIFDVNNTQKKLMEEKRQQYTNDKDEWPSNQHKIVVPEVVPEKNKDNEKTPEEIIIEKMQES